MTEIKNIVFDFGGVLIDWNPEYLYKKVFSNDEDMAFFLQNICTPKWNILQDAGRPLSVATIEKQQEFPQYAAEIAMFYDRWEEMLGGLFDENVKLIEPLKKRYKVYGLTNWSAETLPIAMNRYDFFDKLDGIVVSGDEKLIKPNPRIYQILLHRYHLLPHETLFIDDNAENVHAAQKLGFKTIHLTPNVCLKARLKDFGVDV